MKGTTLHIFIAISIFTLLTLSSCDPDRIYETNIPVQGESWSYDDVKSYTVDIKDTTTAYNIYINVRHSFQFEWRNMYVQVATTFPDHHRIEKRVNLPMSEPDGHWFGSCQGDNCDLPVMIQHDARFPAAGRYIFSIRQDMRVNPLSRIKSMGLRVERSKGKQTNSN